jgi:hypothetical protein
VIPLPLRDALYELFLHTHRLPEGAAILKSRAAELAKDFPSDSKFLKDRVRRYVRVIDAWKHGPPGDLKAELELAMLLFKHGLYFDTHEYLETPWKRLKGERKLQIQGLIQLAAALHKLELDPKAAEGARYLTARGFEKLAGL